MTEPNEYDLHREERIRRNKAMLAKLQVHEKAENVAAPHLAALQQKEAAKEAIRQKYVASGPARQSKRAGAERTRAKLQQQAEESAGSSDDEELVLSDAEDSDSDIQVAARGKVAQASQKRKRPAQEVEFDPADMVQQTSSGSDGDTSDHSEGIEGNDDDWEELQLQQALALSLEGRAGRKQAETKSKSVKNTGKRKIKGQATAAEHTEQEASGKAHAKADSTLQKKPSKGRKAKSISKVGLVNPTAEEMRTAFGMFNSNNRSIISAQDISRVAQEQGYNFDEDDISAMMEVAATVTERASTTSMTFQGFQKLVEHYSTATST